MAVQQDFTPEEWAEIVSAPLFASVAVSAAEPGGLWGTLQEGYANASSIVGGRSHDIALVRDVVGSLSTADGRQLAQDRLKARISDRQREQIVTACLAGLEDIGRIAEAKAGKDAAGFKAWIRDSAVAVAEAANEGGFLGFGGEKVSKKERATLQQISSALGVETA
ncbi:MAG: hypothetical protein KJ587_08025 [Alphaproteobacteria bacterium]|nr:hypothetical protein [Alphaproteobacteria bacterium]